MGSGTRGRRGPKSPPSFFRKNNVLQESNRINFWNVHGLFLPFLPPGCWRARGKGWKEEWLQIPHIQDLQRWKQLLNGEENTAGSSTSGDREISWFPREPRLLEKQRFIQGTGHPKSSLEERLETPSGPPWCPSFHRNPSMQNPDFSGVKPLREAGQPHLGRGSSPREPPGWAFHIPLELTHDFICERSKISSRNGIPSL